MKEGYFLLLNIIIFRFWGFSPVLKQNFSKSNLISQKERFFINFLSTRGPLNFHFRLFRHFRKILIWVFKKNRKIQKKISRKFEIKTSFWKVEKQKNREFFMKGLKKFTHQTDSFRKNRNKLEKQDQKKTLHIRKNAVLGICCVKNGIPILLFKQIARKNLVLFVSYTDSERCFSPTQGILTDHRKSLSRILSRVLILSRNHKSRIFPVVVSQS